MHPRVPERKQSRLQNILRIFTDIRSEEVGTALLMLFNLFLLLLGYYVLKTVREPLILAHGGAEMKSYAAGVQAVLLMGLVPFYGWFSSRVNRVRLIVGMVVFFVVSLEIFYVGAVMDVPYLGFLFFIWLGIYTLAIIAQFWSFANDLYSKEAGERIFPFIAVGAALGSPVGSKVAGILFDRGISPYNMIQVTVGVLFIHLAITLVIHRREKSRDGPFVDEAIRGEGGFKQVLTSPYIRLIALLLILLNLVNSTGEYILSRRVLAAAAEAALVNPDLDIKAFIGSYYADFYFIVNVITLAIQALLVSRIIKHLGMSGALFILPLVALGSYGLVGAGIGFAIFQWLKTAENSTDYSLMNTIKAMLWLPTSRQAKYKAKQAVDTFFVRMGDVLSAFLIFMGKDLLGFTVQRFAWVNLALVFVWLAITWLLMRQNRRIATVSMKNKAEPGP